MTKNNSIIRLLTLITLVLFLTYCATPFAPSGGEKDTSPPAIVKDKSTANKQVNFKKQDIILSFDEWIDLKNIFEQVVISPPLEYPFDLKIKGKSVYFKFDENEILRDNATYTINFGDAVRDITENNPAQDLRFVFATGPYIDSLAVQGTLLDAITKKPIENALFMFYKNLVDSVVYKERPFYFAKSNKEGFFKIENMKNGTYKGVALKDEDLNYLYSKNELIGFLDTLFILKGEPIMNIDTSQATQDSTSHLSLNIPTLNLALFREDPPLQISDIDSSSYGYLMLQFNQTPLQLSIRQEGWTDTLYQEIDHDSLKIWYRPLKEKKSWTLYVNRDSLLHDTIPITANNTPKDKLLALVATQSIQPHSNIQLTFNHPLNVIDTSKIALLEDSIKKEITPTFYFDSISGRRLNLQYRWKEDIPYELLISPGGVTDIFGESNKDSIQLKVKMPPTKLFGNLTLSINNLDTSEWYLCELLYKESKSISKWLIRHQSDYKRTWAALSPGDYQIVIKKDTNKNGMWDSGSYDNHRQIEPIYQKSLEKLRQNWDLDAEVSPTF